jgi:type 1 glutamine amidotransferase
MRPAGASFMLLVVALMSALLAWAVPQSGDGQTAPASQPDDRRPRVLVFSRTAGFRHDSIPEGIKAVQDLGEGHHFLVDATEDPLQFTGENLGRYRAVIFLNTTGDVLNAQQQAAFERFIQAGNGFVGVHAASDTEYDWPWYTRLVGAQFASHPEIQEASITVVDRAHASTKHLAETWRRTDEWYNFRDHPKEKAGGTLRIVATLDESSYRGGEMNGDHPVTWCQEYDGGRAWYTALGHTRESYAEDAFLRHLLGGIQWAMGVEPR